MDPEIGRIYGNRVRVRVCGMCWEGDRLLMVNHRGLRQGDFWAPPGGGVEFGDSIFETLTREFREETGLDIRMGRLMGVCEFLKSPLHAIELFFEVSVAGGTLMTGGDPELSTGNQLISSVAFLPVETIQRLDTGEKHGLFEIFSTEKELKSATGYWKI